LSAEATAGFDALSEKVVARWIEDANSNGIDGQALVNAARAAVAKHTAK
jgi:hypothetical protein